MSKQMYVDDVYMKESRFPFQNLFSLLAVAHGDDADVYAIVPLNVKAFH